MKRWEELGGWQAKILCRKLQCIQNFFPKFCLILKEWFLTRFPPNFQERFLMSSASPEHNDSLWHPLHTKGGYEISMFWGPCLQSSISRLSFSFLALFFCYAVSSSVYDHNHPYLVSERLFLAENEAFPYLRRALAHPRRALAILWDAAATWPVVIFVVVAAKQRSPKMS